MTENIGFTNTHIGSSDCIVKVGTPDGSGGNLTFYEVPSGKNFLLKYAAAHSSGGLKINGDQFLTSAETMELVNPASFPPGTLFQVTNSIAGYSRGAKIIGIEEDRRITAARNKKSI